MWKTTNYGMSWENISEGYEAGCTDYLTKPIDKHELLEKMRDLLV